MPSFTDNTGHTWDVVVDFAAIKRVRARLEFDLLSLENRQEIRRLVGDPVLMVDVLYVVCLPAAEKLSISDEDFGRRLIGDPVDTATMALLEGLADFFPSRKRAVMKRALKEIWALDERLTAKAESMVAGGLADLIQAEEAAFGERLTRMTARGSSESTSGLARSA